MVFGTRPFDPWPREFDYRTKDNRSLAFLMAYAGILLPACWAYIVAPKVTLLLSGSAAAWDWFGFSMMTIFTLGLALLCVSMVWPQIRDVRQRRSQKITANVAGITYEEAGVKIESPWGQVTVTIAPYRIGIMDSSRYVVATRGFEFDFIFRIKDYRLLKEIIERYSLGVKEPGWRNAGPDWNEIAPKPSSWEGARGEAAGRFFGYRPRFNRASLWFLPGLAATFAVQTVLTHVFGLTPHPSLWTGIYVCSGLLLISAWSWWRYFAGGIRVDDTGITQYTPFGTRTIRWDEVTGYKMSGADILLFGNVIAGRRRIRFWFGIARQKELKALIAQKATRCERKTWGDGD